MRARETLAAFAERITNEYRAATSSYAQAASLSAPARPVSDRTRSSNQPPPAATPATRTWAAAARPAAPTAMEVEPVAPSRLEVASIAPGLPAADCQRCKWCLKLLSEEHQNDRCLLRERPALTTWAACVRIDPALRPPAVTRGGATEPARTATRNRGGAKDELAALKVGLSARQRELYRQKYKAWWYKEDHELGQRAASRLAKYMAALQQPLAPSSRSGEFSDYEMLFLDFARLLPHKLRPQQLRAGYSWAALNNSALQIFSSELRSVQPFAKGVAAARMPGERSSTDFAYHYERYISVPAFRAALDMKVAHWRQQLLQRHGGLARVGALGEDAPLVDIFRAVTASRGAPRGADRAETAAAAHPPRETYVHGAFSGEFLRRNADFDARGPGVSAARSKEDVLGASSLLFWNVPSAKEVSGRRQTGKALHYPARRTAAGHSRDVAAWRTEKASEALGPLRAISTDAGTRSSGDTFIVVFGFGVLPDGAVNRRLLGLAMPLPNKTGASEGNSVLRICTENKILRSYIVLSDSARSAIGHKSGAIAYLRREWRTPLIFYLKCTAHKVSRAWQRPVQRQGGGLAERPSVSHALMLEQAKSRSRESR